MYKRTFKVLLAASVIALAIPVQAAVGMPTSDSGGPVVVQKSTPVVGLNLPVHLAAPVVSGTLDPWQQNLNARAKYAQVSDPWALNLFARQSHSDSGQTTAGLSRTVSHLPPMRRAGAGHVRPDSFWTPAHPDIGYGNDSRQTGPLALGHPSQRL